ncbi:MAG: YwqG family protein, partial [Ruminococcus sp.]
MEKKELKVADIVETLLQKSAIPCMQLELTDTTPSILESKVGGLGYVPHDGQIPTDSKGFQLRLLAQIDCSEVTIPDFPHTGLLQFWILNDDLCGCDFDNNTHQDGFRICYYPEIDRTVTEEEVAAKEENNLPFGEDLFPVTGCYGLQFQEAQDMISPDDYRFHEWIMEATRQLYPEQA